MSGETPSCSPDYLGREAGAGFQSTRCVDGGPGRYGPGRFLLRGRVIRNSGLAQALAEDGFLASVVQKYGGLRVDGVARLPSVAERVMRSRRQGHHLVA